MERREEIGGAKGGVCLYAHLARRDVESLEGHGCIQTHSSYQERALSRLFQCTAVLTKARDVTRTRRAYVRILKIVGVVLKICARVCDF